MLNMGFREDIDTILSEVPEEKQMLLFSATMAPEIMKLTETYQKDPVYIQIARKELTTDLTEQRYIEVREPSKIELLCRLIDVNGITLGLVFCNTKRRADQVTSRLQDRGYAADALHGDMKQHERERVMNKFRKGITPEASTSAVCRPFSITISRRIPNSMFTVSEERAEREIQARPIPLSSAETCINCGKS